MRTARGAWPTLPPGECKIPGGPSLLSREVLRASDRRALGPAEDSVEAGLAKVRTVTVPVVRPSGVAPRAETRARRRWCVTHERVHRVQEPGVIDGLGDVSLEPGFEDSLAILRRRMPGHGDDRDL